MPSSGNPHRNEYRKLSIRSRNESSMEFLGSISLAVTICGRIFKGTTEQLTTDNTKNIKNSFIVMNFDMPAVEPTMMN